MLYEVITQQNPAVDIFIGGIVRGEMTTDIAQTGGAQQGVTQCVQDHIAIGMRFQSYNFV